MPLTRYISPASAAAVLLSSALAAGLPATTQAAGTAEIDALKSELAALRQRVEKLEQELSLGVPVNPAREVEAKPGGAKTPDNWQLLAKGMEKYRVTEILGEPAETKTISKFEIWEYPQGRVRFYLGRLKRYQHD